VLVIFNTINLPCFILLQEYAIPKLMCSGCSVTKKKLKSVSWWIFFYPTVFHHTVFGSF